MKTTITSLFTLLLSLLFLSSFAKGTEEIEKPNFIFILADDLGYGDLGCFGQTIIRTPNIDRMAKHGVRFTQFYAGGPVCTSSRASLMTGFNNGNTDIKTMEAPLRKNTQTLGTVFKSNGYRTGMIGKWGLGNPGTTGTPLQQGFDMAYGYYSHIRAHNSYPDYLMRDDKKEFLDNEVVYISDSSHYAVGVGNASVKKKTFSNQVFTEEAKQFISNGSDPFFLYLAYTIPHANNEAWLTKECGMEVPDYGRYKNEDWPEAKKAGASMIEYLDSYVGEILELLEKKGLDKNTIVVFASDNGPHSEGGWKPDFFDSNSIYRGMKRDMYEGGIRVPFIVSCPELFQANVSEQVGAFWDVLPTLANLAHIDGFKSDGINLTSTLYHQEVQQRKDTLYWEFRTPTFKQAVRIGDYKAIRIQSKGHEDKIELYNVVNDCMENYDISKNNNKKLASMIQIMNRYQ